MNSLFVEIVAVYDHASKAGKANDDDKVCERSHAEYVGHHDFQFKECN